MLLVHVLDRVVQIFRALIETVKPFTRGVESF